MYSWAIALSFYVTWRHKIHKFWKIFVSSNGQGQRSKSGQGQLKVKSQGHIIVFTILDVIAVIPFNLWKQNIRALHTIYLNNYNQIDYALDLWPLTFDIDLSQ